MDNGTILSFFKRISSQFQLIWTPLKRKALFSNILKIFIGLKRLLSPNILWSGLKVIDVPLFFLTLSFLVRGEIAKPRENS